MEQKGFRAKVQKFGSYLSGMIMPNIAAFIAWGVNYGPIYTNGMVA